MKTVLFIPGFQEDINSRDYSKTLSVIEKSGYNVKFVPIEWRRTTITDWTVQLNQAYLEHSQEDTILAGFSFGATTAFMSACARPPSQLWLFSLSPYFSEDLANPQFKGAWLRYIGKNREATFRALSFADLTKHITSKTIFFYGSTEIESWPTIDYRQKAIEGSSNMSVVIVPGGEHDVTGEAYVSAISKAI